MKRVLVALALLLVPVLALAQAETTGRVTGTVLDEDRQPVAGADITFESPALQGERKAITDPNGRFLSSLLPPGVYTMTVNAPGKTPVQYTFRIGLGQTIPIDAVLKSGSDLVEDVTVFSPAYKMETTAGGETFNVENTIDQLPVARGGDYLATISNLAPNVSNVTFTGTTVAISGAPSFDNSVLLDGADISDPFYSSGPVVYLEEAIEEVQVITNGASARYGRFQGGVINATTKSGGNTFDGTLRVDLNKQSWNSKTPFNEDQSDTLNKVYSATIGGPILKDHLWFFVGGRTIPETAQTRSQLVVPGSFTSTDNEDRFQGKLTGAINSNHTLSAGYLKYDRERVNYDPFQWVAEANAIIPSREDPREFITAEYQGVLTDRMFINAQYAKKDVSINSGGGRTDVSPILELFDGEYRAYANGWFDPYDPSVRNNESAAASMTHALSGGSWGDHTLEYGIQYVDSITAGDNRQSPTGYNLYFVEPNAGNDTSFAECDAAGNCTFDFDSDLWFYERLKAIPGAGEQNMKNLAIYVQDGWEVGKWRFDLGLRWENWKGEAISPAMTLDFDEISPRLGLTYNVTSDWQLQASWGKYVARFNDGVANGVTGISSIYGPGILQEYVGPDLSDQTPEDVQDILENDAYWGTILGFVDPLQPTTFFADNIGGPYAYDLNLSVKRALPRNSGVLTATYTRRTFKDLLEDYKGGNGVIEVTPPAPGEPEDVDVVIWDNCPNCNRDYEAITVAADYRPSSRWDLGGNYTYSRTRGNYEGEASGQPAIGSIIGNYERTIFAPSAYPLGYLNSDIRHRARVWGNYRFDFGAGGQLTLGGLFTYRSGASWSRTARVAAETDTAPDYSGAPSSYTAFFDGRGNNRFSGFWSLDATVRYDISFWRDLGVYAKFDVQNLTGEDSLISYRTGGSVDSSNPNVWVPNANFGTASSERNYQTPRSYFVSVGFAF
jgi:hypothetical protein